MGSEAQRLVLLQILEFITGRSLAFSMTGSNRRYQKLIDMLSADNLGRGRRACELTLPPLWAIGGLLCIGGLSEDKASILLQHRFTGQAVELSLKLMPPHSDISELYVYNNHSEMYVAIASKTDGDDHMHDYLVGNYFKEFAGMKQEVSGATPSQSASQGIRRSRSGRALDVARHPPATTCQSEGT